VLELSKLRNNLDEEIVLDIAERILLRAAAPACGHLPENLDGLLAIWHPALEK